MSSRTCESCSGSGERPSLGHMPAYKCTKCSGSGRIHNFNDIIAQEKLLVEAKTLDEINKSAEKTPENQLLQEPKKRGRPAKI